jgi:adenylate cyclase
MSGGRARSVAMRESALPDRLRQTIRRQQDDSEILIGWAQLVVGLALTGLYLASPKAGSGLDLAPFALTIYLGFTAVRLVWAHITRIPDWALAASVIFDVALLMTLIWSFHVKYAQPPSFYLKAPTLLYIFIFIALRALRFELRFVILTGVFAAIGWLVLTFYALLSGPEPMMVTSDYVTYLTSNSVMIGTEIDKVLSILTVTAILGLVIYRARKLLVQAVVEQTAAQDLSRFFVPEIAERIKTSTHEIRAGTGESRQGAILSLDLRGFTHYASQTEPDAVMKLLSEYQAQMVPVIRKHGGRVDKFLGDGILATFGVIEPSTTYAADGLRAMDELIATGHRWAGSSQASGPSYPEVNGALAAGQVLFGAVGDEQRLEYTVIGEVVNLSAKLEKANKDMGTMALCDAPTYDLAVTQGYRPLAPKVRLPKVAIPGVESPLDVVRLAP